jgi:hypothetical protein
MLLSQVGPLQFWLTGSCYKFPDSDFYDIEHWLRDTMPGRYKVEHDWNASEFGSDAGDQWIGTLFEFADITDAVHFKLRFF